MASIIDICNLALAHIGQGNINSLDERSTQAEQCNLFYSYTEKSLLRQFPWNFATKSITLAQVSTTNDEWAYVYMYPPECLHIRKIFNAEKSVQEINNEYQVITDGINKFICCDVNDAKAKCTIDIPDPMLYDPLFVDVLTYRLALNLIMPLTNSATRTQEITQKYQYALSLAMISGAIEGAEKRSENNKIRSNRSYINAMR